MSLLTSGRAAVLSLLVGTFSATYFKAEASDLESVSVPDAVYSHAIVGGLDAAKKATEGYLGVIAAFNGDLDRDGSLFRGLGTYGYYRDVGINFADINDNFLQGDVMLGYQVISDGVTIAGYVGADFQDHDLSPDDPAVPLRGSEAGFKVALDIETERNKQRPIYAALYGAYSTAFDSYSVVGRGGLNMGRLAIGPEGMLLGDVSGDAQRLGVFALTDVSLGGPTIGTLSASVGYQFVDNADSLYNFGEEGVYGTLQFTMAFGSARQESYRQGSYK